MAITINVGVRGEKKFIFIANEEGENLGEIEISDRAFEIMLEELKKEEKIWTTKRVH